MPATRTKPPSRSSFSTRLLVMKIAFYDNRLLTCTLTVTVPMLLLRTDKLPGDDGRYRASGLRSFFAHVRAVRNKEKSSMRLDQLIALGRSSGYAALCMRASQAASRRQSPC